MAQQMSAEYAELQANLAEYKEQLQQLEDLLLDEPENEEYQGLFRDVQEAITLTEDALQSAAGGAQASSSAPDGDADGAASRKRKSRFDTSADNNSGASGGALPTQVLDQIRSAKARSALEGTAPPGWALGYPCSARDTDGRWQPATVSAVTPDGKFQVTWAVAAGAAAASATVERGDCRPRDTGAYKGVGGAPTRKLVNQVSSDAYARYLRGESGGMPAWLELKEGDTEKQREKKLRARKAFKKAKRFEEKDLQSTKQANDWKAFIGGKGGKKKAGFMTGQKKESMFAVPDNPNGKVGVVGSGAGMTDPPTGKRSRLDF